MSGQVAKPKIYIDYIAYARAIGKPVGHIPNASIVGTHEGLFTQNPSNTNVLERTGEGEYEGGSVSIYCRLDEIVGAGNTYPFPDQDLEFAKLHQSMNYIAVLGHNIFDCGFTNFTMRGVRNAGNWAGYNLLGQPKYGFGSNGFTMWQVYGHWATDQNGFGILLNMVGAPATDPDLRIGSISAGRSFSFPHSANLSMNINYSADGIRKSRTLGGRDIVDINYYKQPDWDGRPPFASTNASNLTTHVGRRRWDLTFSYLQADNTFPQDMGEGFMFDNVFDEAGGTTSWDQHDTENIT